MKNSVPIFVFLVCFLTAFATRVSADFINLAGVSSGTPNFTDRALATTEFDGTLISEGGLGSTPSGQANGDFSIGAGPSGFETYRFDFDDAVNLEFSKHLSIAGVFGSSDVWTLTSPGAIFAISDPGTPDLINVTNAVGGLQ